MRRLGLFGFALLASNWTICCQTPTPHASACVTTPGTLAVPMVETMVFDVVVNITNGGACCAGGGGGTAIWATLRRPRICHLLYPGVSVPLTAFTSKNTLLGK